MPVAWQEEGCGWQRATEFGLSCGPAGRGAGADGETGTGREL